MLRIIEMAVLAFQLLSQEACGGEDQLGFHLATGEGVVLIIRGAVTDRRNTTYHVPFGDDGHGATDKKRATLCQHGNIRDTVSVHIKTAPLHQLLQVLRKRFVVISLPVMWVGLMLQSLLCEGGWKELFPLHGLAVPEPDKFSIWQLQLELIRHYTLPVFCLAYGGFAGLSRYARSGMLDVIHSDYIRTARAKGSSEMTVIWCHGFRNALITLITLFGGLLPGLVAGSVIVEYIFNIPGMGSLSLLALSSRDYPLQMALFAFSGFLTLAGIMISDFLYVAADPRIKLS